MADGESPQNTGAIKKKKDEKHRKRDPRSWENVKKNIQSLTNEEKMEYLSERYNELYLENRNLNATLQAREKQMSNLQKDCDRDRTDLSKAILAKGHLESLCRELQKQNKAIKEENVARIKEEEDRRREVANTFTERLNTLTNLITESKDKSNKVKEENQSMSDKLTELYEQYQQRESHLETVTKQLDLQKKLAETQAKKRDIEFEAERHTLLAESKALKMQLEQYEKEIILLQEKNRSFEAQVDLYKSQYTDFETTMTKSNKVFDTFKEEMSRMNKQLHIVESERTDLRNRWVSSVNSLIALSEQHMGLASEQSTVEKRLALLQKLFRKLQDERTAFLKQLKEHNIEPQSLEPQEAETAGLSEQPTETSALENQTSKALQTALRLRKELKKVKEVAQKFTKDSYPEALDTECLVDALQKDFATMKVNCQTSDKAIGNLLQEQSDTNQKNKKKKSKRIKNKDTQDKIVDAIEEQKDTIEIKTETRICNGIHGCPNNKTSKDDLNQPEEATDEERDTSVPIHRSPAAFNLPRAYIQVGTSDSGVVIDNISIEPEATISATNLTENAAAHTTCNQCLELGSNELLAVHKLDTSSNEDIATDPLVPESGSSGQNQKKTD